MAMFKSALALRDFRLPDLGAIKRALPCLRSDQRTAILIISWLLRAVVAVSLLRKFAVLCPPGEVRETKWPKQTWSRKWTFLYHFAKVAATFIMMMQALLMLLGLVGPLYAEHIPLDVFQVYEPVTFAPQSENGCDLNVLLMEHVFGASYGKPFVGK